MSIRSPIELPKVCSRHRISNRSVTCKVRAEDFADVAKVRRNDRAGQWAIEVSDQAQTEAKGHIGVATKRDLMGTIKQGRAVVASGLIVVRGTEYEILVAVTRGARQLLATGVAEV